MAKILNLDSLTKEERVLTIEGVTYPMKDMSVENFLDITNRAEQIDKQGGDSIAKRIEFMAETALISFPTCPKEVMMGRSLAELDAIVSFARDGSLPETPEATDEAPKGKKARKRG